MAAICPQCKREDQPTYKGRNTCKDCYRKQRRGNRKRSQKFVYEYKLSNSECMDCEVSYPPYVLEFDHRPEEKKTANVADMASNGCGLDTIKKEIDKCDLVCANCHRIRTFIIRKDPSNSGSFY